MIEQIYKGKEYYFKRPLVTVTKVEFRFKYVDGNLNDIYTSSKVIEERLDNYTDYIFRRSGKYCLQKYLSSNKVENKIREVFADDLKYHCMKLLEKAKKFSLFPINDGYISCDMIKGIKFVINKIYLRELTKEEEKIWKDLQNIPRPRKNKKKY